MPRQSEPGIPALYKYQELKYFPFKVDASASLLLTSDPFSFMKAHLELQSKKRNGAAKERLIKAKYFVGQSESFFHASSFTNLPTKGTLIYYCLLNLVKAFISVRGVELEKKQEIHGLSLSQVNVNALTISGLTNNSINIFNEFCKQLGKPVTGKHDLDIKDIVSDIPEIHELCFVVGQLNNSKRKLLPIEVEFLVNAEKTFLFTEISYQKKSEFKVNIEKFHQGDRLSYFKLVSGNDDGWVTYRSKTRKSVNQQNIGTKYLNICRDYDKFSISSLLTRGGYKYYINLKPGKYHHLASTLMLAFYIGSAARYKPTLTQKIMQSELRPILTEAVDTSPNQFIYQIASLMTQNVVAVPQAKL